MEPIEEDTLTGTGGPSVVEVPENVTVVDMGNNCKADESTIKIDEIIDKPIKEDMVSDTQDGTNAQKEKILPPPCDTKNIIEFKCKTVEPNKADENKSKLAEIIIDHNSEYVELNSIIQDFNKSEIKNVIVSSTPIPNEKIPRSKSDKDDKHLWIYNINPSTTAGQLKLDLSKYGKVLVAKIVTNGDKYFGYALMERAEQVKLCIDKLNKKIMDGFQLEVSADPPNKRKFDAKEFADKKREARKASSRSSPRRSRKRSRSQDPLTLKVESKKSHRSSSNSRTRRKRIEREREEEAIRLRKQRAFEVHIEEEKRKLESEKRNLEREKLAFLKMQKKMREDRERERKHDELVKKSLERARSPARKHGKTEGMKHPATPVPKQGYRQDYKENRSSGLNRSKQLYRFDAPPPPRLTTEDLPRDKADPWKASSDSKKPSRDYYREGFGDREVKDGKIYPQREYSERKPYERKYLDDDKKKRYDTKPPTCRSEVYLVSSRSNPPYVNSESTNRRFDNVAYPVQPSRSYVPPNPAVFQPMQHMNGPPVQNWTRPAYANVQNAKPYYQDHQRYEDRNQYFNANRRY